MIYRSRRVAPPILGGFVVYWRKPVLECTNIEHFTGFMPVERSEMKKVYIALHYEPLSVWGYKRTILVHCHEKTEQQALVYAKSLATQPDYAPEMTRSEEHV